MADNLSTPTGPSLAGTTDIGARMGRDPHAENWQSWSLAEEPEVYGILDALQISESAGLTVA